MPNVFTRVPDQPVPPLPSWTAVPLRIADIFMVALWSRPPTGTLATTWVTPGTLQLTIILTPVNLVLGLALIGIGGAAIWVIVGIVLVLMAIGSGAVALIGLAQRRGGPGIP